MITIHFNPRCSDEQRRNYLYQGDLVVLPPSAVTREFCEFARSLIEEAFAPLDPEKAQYEMPVERYAEILGELKPRFIHHPKSKEYIRGMFEEYGCDLDKTYFEVPKLRTSTSDGYLTTGIAYAWHPHRDTWTAALPCQINWWLPVYELRSDNTMRFFPAFWDRPVANSSSGYNYYKWNEQHRGEHVTKYLKADPRPLPRPTEDLDLSSDTRVICPVGGIILFSGAHLHASVENTSGRTRFSFDFRTVHLDDIGARKGAANIDSQCEGHMLRDYLRSTDQTHIPDTYYKLYDDGTETEGSLLYEPGTR